ncbi:MAG TPA: hypothetical protein VKD22_02465 [Ramlibacter sp.]|nr:hypothetical protein [Ramlibacter sp.]
MAHHLRRLVALVALLVLASCGGGTADTTQSSISGNVIKGPVSGATVKALAVSGGLAGAQVASTVTDADGAFVLAMGDYTGPVMLQTSGGSYVDEATGTTMSVATGDTMTAMLPTMARGATIAGVQVTPLTGMAQTMAARLSGGLTDANIAAANQAVGHYFMVDDIVRTRPMNPLVAGSASAASQSMVNYGMALAAMSQYARNAAIPVSSTFVTALMNDAADGVLDGQDGSATLTIMRGMTGGGLPVGSAGSTGLASAMTDFANSRMNVSGVPAAALAPLVQQLGSMAGRMR